jgi:lipopolysaccharide heptosyltransferase II
MKILLIDLDNIGDVVMASFLPHYLKILYPGSHLTCLVKEYSREVLGGNPFIDMTIIFNPPWLGDMLDKRFDWPRTRELVRTIKADKYDLAVVVNSDWRKALIPWLARIPLRVGADKKKAGFFLNKAVTYKFDKAKHTVEYNADLLRALGEKDPQPNLEVYVTAEAKRWAEEFLAKNDVTKKTCLIGIHPGAGHPARIWPVENYVELIHEMLKAPNAKVMVVGSNSDHSIREIKSKLNKYQVIFVNDISLQNMAALFQKCTCVIAQDSGPMHVATAVGTRVAALFGPSDPRRFGPYGEGHIVVKPDIDCSPCGSDPVCEKMDCWKQVTVGRVMSAVKQLAKLKIKEQA